MDEGFNKSVKKLREYGINDISIIDIMECVSAYQKYENLPQATKDSLQIIADLHNVSFTFTLLKGQKLCLTGINNELRATYLYTDETLKDREIKRHWPKNNVEFILKPFANNRLDLVKEF